MSAFSNLAFLHAETASNLDDDLRQTTTVSQKIPSPADLADTVRHVYRKQESLPARPSGYRGWHGVPHHLRFRESAVGRENLPGASLQDPAGVGRTGWPISRSRGEREAHFAGWMAKSQTWTLSFPAVYSINAYSPAGSGSFAQIL